MQSIPSHPTSLISILMLSSHPWLSLPSGLFLSALLILRKCGLVAWFHWDLMIPGLDCLWHRTLSTAGRVKHYYQIFFSDQDGNICDHKHKWPEHAQGNHCVHELASKNILWCIDSLLGNDHCQAAFCSQQWKYCFLCGSLWGYVTWLNEFSSVSECRAVEYSAVKWVGWAVSQRTAAVHSSWAIPVRHRDSSRTQNKGNVCHWKLLPRNG
jgi:hypothetical protein